MSILDLDVHFELPTSTFEIGTAHSIAGTLIIEVGGPVPLDENVEVCLRFLGTESHPSAFRTIKETTFVNISTRISPALHFRPASPNKYAIPFLFQLPFSSICLPTVDSVVYSVKYVIQCDAYPNIPSASRTVKTWSTPITLNQPPRFAEQLLSQNCKVVVTNWNLRKKAPISNMFRRDPSVDFYYELHLPDGQTYHEGALLSGTLHTFGVQKHDVHALILTHVKFQAEPTHAHVEIPSSKHFDAKWDTSSEVLICSGSGPIESFPLISVNFRAIVPSVPSIDTDLMKVYHLLQIRITNRSHCYIIQIPLHIVKLDQLNSKIKRKRGRNTIHLPYRISIEKSRYEWPEKELEDLLPQPEFSNSDNDTVLEPHITVLGQEDSDQFYRVGSEQMVKQLVERNSTLDIISSETILAHIDFLTKLEKLHNLAGFNADDFNQNKHVSVDLHFYCLAESRYIKWMEYLSNVCKDGITEVPLPPLDVAMFWSAHMLNPMAYDHDTKLGSGKNWQFNLPLLKMDSSNENIQRESLYWDSIWENDGQEDGQKDVPFNLRPELMSTIQYQCLWCAHLGRYSSDMYMKFRFQEGDLLCQSCQRVFNSDNTSVKFFLDDLKAKNLCPSSSVTEYQKLYCLEFTFRNLISLSNNSHIPPTWQTVVDYIRNISENLFLSVRFERNDLIPILQSYQGRVYKNASIDLIEAVYRQRTFIHNVKSGSLNTSSKSVETSIVRYHRFLMLMKDNPKQPLVPMIDIDLCWHTHQLHPQAYKTYGISLIGKLINHNDSVSTSEVLLHSKTTSEVWENTYGESYNSKHSIVINNNESVPLPPYENIIFKISPYDSKITQHLLEPHNEKQTARNYRESILIEFDLDRAGRRAYNIISGLGNGALNTLYSHVSHSNNNSHISGPSGNSDGGSYEVNYVSGCSSCVTAGDLF
ncbi:hypothetical protein BJ742DRAFT_573115 [Cladochytrium replicatum]|nr:hypothetical protein BJ742DRAFT_573115 [Cladochytrium replicatum]